MIFIIIDYFTNERIIEAVTADDEVLITSQILKLTLDQSSESSPRRGRGEAALAQFEYLLNHCLVKNISNDFQKLSLFIVD